MHCYALLKLLLFLKETYELILNANTASAKLTVLKLTLLRTNTINFRTVNFAL